MTATVKQNTGLTVPAQVQRRAGLKPGDQVEFKVAGGVINIIRKRSSPSDEFTPGQRRTIDAQLAEGLKDIRMGRVSAKFNTVDEMLDSLKAKPRQKKPRSRR